MMMKLESEQIEKFDRKADKILNILIYSSYILVAIVVGAIIIIVAAFMLGFAPVDRDVADWCDEYQPTWTYEQCEGMVGR